MILTAEITMYPLQTEYIPPIQKMIDKLNSYAGLKVQTTPTATILTGEFTAVTQAIADAMHWSHTANGKAVFIVKYLPDYEPF